MTSGRDVVRLAEEPKKDLRFGQSLRAWRAQNGYKPSAFARLVGVSAQTVYRWEAGHKPRAAQLTNLRSVLISGTPSNAQREPTGDTKHKDGEGIWSEDELHGRMKLASEVWLIKAKQPFRAGVGTATRSVILSLLMQPEPPHFHYLYPVKPDDAKKSFEDFKRVATAAPGLAERFQKFVHARQLDPSQMSQESSLDLLATVGGWVVIKYRELHQNTATHDIFVEVPVQSYRHGGRGSSDYHYVWVELPQSVTSSLLERWAATLGVRETSGGSI